ncbi:MAG: cellulase family glycosylhydrolase [Tepidisphaeraceae bacterium]
MRTFWSRLRSAFAVIALSSGLLVTTNAEAARGRPTATGPLKTFVSDTGTLLRGPRLSTEVGTLPARSTIQALKNYGCNALHVYAERSDYGYAAGTRAATLDTLVQWTRDDGIYLIITIGNGGINESFIQAFWNFYAGRYANETHVLYEIQNEAVSSPGVPATAITAELNAYNLIRSKAPNTPVLFFSYIAFSNGAKVIQDINALGSGVDWTKAGIAFHGYGTGGRNATRTCMQYVQNAGYPCVQTEFYVWLWGTGNFSLGAGVSIYADTDQTGDYERLGCSWLSFLDVSQISTDARFKDRFAQAGILWTPDYGTWPSGSRGTYGNSNEPWTQSGLSATLRIEAENYDNGGQGISYNDANTANQGGAYRTTGGVDIETTSDTGGGYNVSYIQPGEWIEYTTYINEPGLYNLKLRVASPNATNSVQINLGGTDLTGTWTFPATGGYQAWTTITKTVRLNPGQQVMRINALTNGFNLNWIEFTPVTTGLLANGTYQIVNRNSGKAMDVVAPPPPTSPRSSSGAIPRRQTRNGTSRTWGRINTASPACKPASRSTWPASIDSPAITCRCTPRRRARISVTSSRRQIRATTKWNARSAGWCSKSPARRPRTARSFSNGSIQAATTSSGVSKRRNYCFLFLRTARPASFDGAGCRALVFRLLIQSLEL